MNSQYGSLGANLGYLPCKPAAAAVTATGRQMILATKTFVEKHYGGQVIYGDSVAGRSPVVIRGLCGLVEVLQIDQLCHRWHPCGDGKECGLTPRCEVWTEKGWTPVVRVIRHRAHKRMYRVTSMTGVIEVTEDHSLLFPDGFPVQPCDVRPGSLLLSSCASLPCMTECGLEGAAAMGRSCADGCRIPLSILNSPHPTKHAFWKAFLRGRPHVCSGDTVFLAQVFLLAMSLGVVVVVGGPAKLCFPSLDPQMFCSLRGMVVRVEPLCMSQHEYVYDLTTENHHFQAGVGELVVHNTDSVFVKLPGHRDVEFKDLFALGAEIATGATALFRPPVQLEFEKEGFKNPLPIHLIKPSWFVCTVASCSA